MKEKNKFEDIGLRLKRLREALVFTLEGLSKETGVSRSYLSDFERGLKLPTSKYLLYLNEKYNVNLNFVFTGKSGMFIPEDEQGVLFTGLEKYEEDIHDLLFHITRIPAAFFAVMAYFSEYKAAKEDFIKECLKKQKK